ncbi:hypothetical protein NPIL_15601 [Nephila pilipes]|uniref:Uncharacterized protein n=1 Tax=Nephila pilipes TaxID=299642 RepID=A0A8X6PZ30_NEPPI|nr:hypothetical protein NPIL_15601 [Nephila pilipes]
MNLVNPKMRQKEDIKPVKRINHYNFSLNISHCDITNEEFIFVLWFFLPFGLIMSRHSTVSPLQRKSGAVAITQKTCPLILMARFVLPRSPMRVHYSSHVAMPWSRD